MQPICLLSCSLNIGTLLNVAYGGLLFWSWLEAAPSRENFNSDVFMLNIGISDMFAYIGAAMIFTKQWEYHCLPSFFETDISWK